MNNLIGFRLMYYFYCVRRKFMGGHGDQNFHSNIDESCFCLSVCIFGAIYVRLLLIGGGFRNDVLKNSNKNGKKL